MNAKQFFGIGPIKETGKDSTNRQVGDSSATSGVNSITNNRGGAGTGTQANLSTRPLYRPNIPGKVDNRKVGQ